jgi:hypothetical protein
MSGRRVWCILALCGVPALCAAVSGTPCRFSVEQRRAPHAVWKGRIGTTQVVTFQDMGARGEAAHRGGGVFWTGAICTRSGRLIGNVLLRLPDEMSSTASGSFLIAPSRRRQFPCDVYELTHAGLGDQIVGNSIAGACADGRPVSLKVRHVWNICASHPGTCIPVQMTDPTSVTTTTLRCPAMSR